MSKSVFIFVFVLSFALLGLPALSQATEHLIINYAELNPEASMTEEEMESCRMSSDDFAEAEEELESAYENAREEFGPGGEGWLKMNQGDWAKNRQNYAYENYAPKGSPEYLNYMIQQAVKRTKWLDQLAGKSWVVFTHNYIYQKPGYEGIVILYYRNDAQEMEIYTRNLETGAICKSIGEAVITGGKADYNGIALEMVELGKSLDITAQSETGICQPGGSLTGTYILTK